MESILVNLLTLIGLLIAVSLILKWVIELLQTLLR